MCVAGGPQPHPSFPFETSVAVSYITVKRCRRNLELKAGGSLNIWGEDVPSRCLPICALGGGTEIEIAGRDRQMIKLPKDPLGEIRAPGTK